MKFIFIILFFINIIGYVKPVIACEIINDLSFRELEDCGNKGNVLSQYNLGVNYRDGKGVPQNFERGFYWTKKAADQGMPEAQLNLSWFYETGFGTEKNFQKAFEYAYKAGEQGFILAFNNLGKYYQEGIGVKQDSKKAFEYYSIVATKLEHPIAQINLGSAYFYGKGVEKDVEKGLFWTNRAAEQGEPFAMVNLGKYYKELNQYEKAFFWTKKSAELNNSLAQANLGFMYAEGMGILPNKDEAIFWLEESMAQNNSYAYFLMGTLYAKKNGIFLYDESKAYEYYLKAAEMGEKYAQYNLANWLMDGRYIEKNEQLAILWYERSANSGTIQAMVRLSKIYSIGTKNIAQDLEKSRYWLEKAKENGFVPPE